MQKLLCDEKSIAVLRSSATAFWTSSLGLSVFAWRWSKVIQPKSNLIPGINPLDVYMSLVFICHHPIHWSISIHWSLIIALFSINGMSPTPPSIAGTAAQLPIAGRSGQLSAARLSLGSGYSRCGLKRSSLKETDKYHGIATLESIWTGVILAEQWRMVAETEINNTG